MGVSTRRKRILVSPERDLMKDLIPYLEGAGISYSKFCEMASRAALHLLKDLQPRTDEEIRIVLRTFFYDVEE